MLLNNISISDRNNRPVVLSKVGLQAHFISDGEYADPFEISAVTIFQKSSNFYPSAVLNSDTQLIDTSAVSGSIKMNFANSSADISDDSFLPTSYDPTLGPETASGIYRISTGKYIVVLDGVIGLSGVINLDGANTVIENSASSTGDYIDVWTITWVQDSLPQTVINEFSLRKGGFTVVTQPVMLKAKNRLVNSKVTLGSKVDIKIATDVHIENRDIDASIKNLMRENVITDCAMEIIKLNDATNLPAHVTVSSFAQTSSLVEVTSDNVMVFNWDTSTLSTHPQLVAGNFGSIRGIYSIRSKFNMFNEVITSEPMYLTLS
jgi:hypothetical protein